MILVDTSVWVDHLSSADAGLAGELDAQNVLVHPLVIGELACGRLSPRRQILRDLGNLPLAPVATEQEAMLFLEDHQLWRRGIGYVDVHLLASAALAGDARLWTRDKRLAAAAAELHLGREERK